MSKEYNVYVFIDQMQYGGAARVTSVMCNGLVDKGYRVTVILDNTAYAIKFPLSEKVVVKNLAPSIRGNSKVAALRRSADCLRRTRKIINDGRPDVIIAVQPVAFFYSLLAKIGLRIPIIVCDHTSFSRKVGGLYDFSRHHLYRFADVVTILTERDAKILGNRLPQKEVVYNPLPFSLLESHSERKKNILCAGRIESWYIKGFDTIIEIWSRIQGKYPEWVLEIAGGSADIAEAVSLQQLIDKYGLSDRVNLLGNVDDMKSLLGTTSIFALPSRVEGFPMILIEAMSQGCACVAFEEEGALNEMISSKTSGLVVHDNDINAFEASLISLIENEELRESMSHSAIQEVSRFSSHSFIEKWDIILSKVI